MFDGTEPPGAPRPTEDRELDDFWVEYGWALNGRQVCAFLVAIGVLGLLL